MNKTTMCFGAVTALLVWATSPVLGAPLGTVFTYQGRLTQGGTPVTDTSPGCDFEFSLWEEVAGVTQIGATQTILGVAWAVIQPLFMMVIFTIFFGRLAKIPSDGLPYPIFAFTALLPWQLFSRALTDASTSLVVNERLITKVYFPRLLVPASAVLASLVDFAIALILLAGMMIYYGIVPTGAIWTLPLFILLALMTALGGNSLFRNLRNSGVKASMK